MIFTVPSHNSPISRDNDEENASKSFFQSWHSFCDHQVLRKDAAGWRKRRRKFYYTNLALTASLASPPLPSPSHTAHNYVSLLFTSTFPPPPLLPPHPHPFHSQETPSVLTTAYSATKKVFSRTPNKMATAMKKCVRGKNNTKQKMNKHMIHWDS